MNQIFKNVGGVKPPRSVFNLSYEKKFTCDMGQLIPVCCDEMVPGDIFDISAQMIIRFQPLVAPVLHAVDVSVYYFFCPYRLLWSSFEDFITGGPEGNLVPTVPIWEPLTDAGTAVGSLWDFMGFPTFATHPAHIVTTWPIDYPRRAYAFVWNEYFRDETLQDPLVFDPFPGVDNDNDTLILPMNSNWEKDYFTSALKWQQRGTSPAFPLVGTSAAVWGASAFSNNVPGAAVGFTDAEMVLRTGAAGHASQAETWFNSNVVDLSSANPISISDLRVGFQTQRWMERNARAGARYTEFLRAQFGASPNDERLDRPEYIGGMKAPIIFTEVLQTSETDTTPQGNLAGHGLSVNIQSIGKYRAEEFGCVIGIFRIMPKPAYQQGINRQWFRKTKFEHYFPVFAHLSEQAITRGELYWMDDNSGPGADANNNVPFGFCGAYDEMRVKQNMVCGEFRDVYDYWHLGRQFGSAPLLNESFIECIPRKDIFAVPAEPGCLVQYGNIIKALRPMPIISEPGLIDHG